MFGLPIIELETPTITAPKLGIREPNTRRKSTYRRIRRQLRSEEERQDAGVVLNAVKAGETLVVINL
jgi:hypothetical protein